MAKTETFPFRYTLYALSLTGFIVSLLASTIWGGWFYVVPVLLGGLAATGTWDLLQRKRTVSRNYPILAHFRYFLESIGPEIRQYFIQSDTDERPFSREQRTIVYQRAKNVLDKRPFGSQLGMYDEGFEWINHSLQPSALKDADFRIVIGKQCAKPYNASVFNISAMSFGSLSANAILSLNAGAKMGNFYHDTGEGSISRYHREPGGDLVWEIGSGYFGCRNEDGTFNEERFARNATLDQVKMIEVKLSQGAKPGHGGILPGEKVTPEIAEARGVEAGKDVVSPASHSAFSTPREFLEFLEKLRELSGGKPVGFKLAIGHPWEWFAIVKAMLETGKTPDFIVVDGGEGGTGAAPLEFINRIGTPMTEALLLVHNTLVGTNLREHIAIGAAGKITSAFNIARTLALGADWCNAARGYMFSLGCIQALSCHTGKCPSGVATQDPRRSQKLDVQDKSQRVYNYHKNTLEALMNLLEASGLKHPSELGPEHIIRRTSKTETHSYMDLFPFLEPGALLEGETGERVFDTYWPNATPDSFDPPEFIRQLRETKLR
ncbi:MULTISPECIES: FMN-binding glutamate synthase family protein [Marinobacter]|jgi:glutamate synthase domain-containing protein 2|uniref:FMN-binding glutamate synthase family protein n=1 Tax=Marinobacter TaxID=2742 RepID=UPI000FCA7D17|nr:MULTISPECIES: FMN-binding glutamate synthase family protein [Marinobacter]MCC4285614.1 FMN-binding glutamate synthase family protein [Marinobacter salarius]MCZ4284509.1 FMN-binding glutamate synthase family protein [Marinobacter salarius]MDC8454834.1 FMN-binding glutamate synthase family protein [Marinobacter sp. DS40M6]MDM8181453.1 FMN-binding glutamate synthase family protein [Marinobacter salarius]RUT74121.1 FMN-binding glutamate synthase family protein [Marinobacter sp. NP-6]